MTIANLIKSLRSVQSENSQAIRELTNLRNSISGSRDGSGVLYGDDVNAIRSYQNRAHAELSQTVNELNQLNGKIDEYITRITR